MPREGIEIVQRLRLRENSGSMEFAGTKEVSRRLPWELKFVRYIIRLEDHSVGARDEYESEASEASVLCFDNTSPEKSCFLDGLVCFISLCLLVFMFLNATRRDRNCPTFASKGKKWIHGIH